jgi:hypothetical protein
VDCADLGNTDAPKTKKEEVQAEQMEIDGIS